METRPTEVAEKPKQAGEIRSGWEWTEPSVWTENMLMTPTTGDKMYSNIFDEHGLSSLYKTYVKFVNPGIRVNRQLESRMREIRQSGSEGGDVQINAPSLPLSPKIKSECHQCCCCFKKVAALWPHNLTYRNFKVSEF